MRGSIWGAQEFSSKQPARPSEALLKAIEADGKLVEPYVELGEMAAREQNWPDAARYLDRALQLDPVDYPRLWFEDAVADYNMQKYDRAEKNAREALKLPAGQSRSARQPVAWTDSDQQARLCGSW